MADEWSKPVKDESGDWRSETVGAPMGHYHDALLRDGYIGEGMDRTTAIPAHVALRLLAAEASDRLGWVWRPYQMPPGPLHMCCEIGGEWWFDNGTSGAGTPVEATPTFRFGLVKSSVHGGMPFPTPDELLALHHGRFLLEDALREAGR